MSSHLLQSHVTKLKVICFESCAREFNISKYDSSYTILILYINNTSIFFVSVSLFSVRFVNASVQAGKVLLELW